MGRNRTVRNDREGKEAGQDREGVHRGHEGGAVFPYCAGAEQKGRLVSSLDDPQDEGLDLTVPRCGVFGAFRKGERETDRRRKVPECRDGPFLLPG